MSFRFVPTQRVIENSKKIAKIFKKLKKHDYGFFSSQNMFGKAEKDIKIKIKINIVPMSSYQTRNRKLKKKKSFRQVPTRLVIENSKNIVKKFKKSKYTIMASFQAKIGWKRQRKSKK